MKKAKATSKGTAKKTVKKRARKVKKDVDLAEVRKDIAKIVGSEAKSMTEAVVGEALKGQLAPVKYLFEVSGLYPPTPETAGTGEADSLANLLLKQLHLPPAPVATSDEEATTSSAGCEEGDTENKSTNKSGDEENTADRVVDTAVAVP